MPKRKENTLKDQSRRLRDSMVWLVRGFTLYDPRKAYPGFYLSPQQSYVLSVVHDSGPVSPGEVARRLRLEKSHVTKIVNSLVKIGAVEKQRDPRDRRRQILSATPRGREIYAELEQLSMESYTKLMEKIPASERQKVVEAAELMLQAIEELRKEQG